VVDWSGPSVRVETDDDAFEADRVVVTVPGPLVGALGFFPALPAEKARALAELNLRTAAKVIVQYAEREVGVFSRGAGASPMAPRRGLSNSQSIRADGDPDLIAARVAITSRPSSMKPCSPPSTSR